MSRYRIFVLFLALAIGSIGFACNTESPLANSGKSDKPTAEEIGKQWGFDVSAAFGENGTYSHGGDSNGDKLKLGQITIKIGTFSYSETYARVVKFYTKKMGYKYDYDAKKMVTKKGENENGQFIFFDVRGAEPRESSFVYNTTDYSVSGLIRPALAKDTVEVIITITVR